jgi:dihydrofolate reductase
MSISANGYIAMSDGSEDFLPDDTWYRFAALAKEFGCFIWGRKTYEQVIKWDKVYLDAIRDTKKIIVSRKDDIKLEEGFELVHTPQEAIKLLENDGFKQAILTGGSILNTSFAKLNLIDEVILAVVPTILGRGIPLFNSEDFQLPLKSAEVERINGDIVRLRYTVVK